MPATAHARRQLSAEISELRADGSDAAIEAATTLEADFEDEHGPSGTDAAGGPRTDVVPQPADADAGGGGAADDRRPSGDLERAKRSELEAYARDLGIDNPDDTDAYPNKGALVDAIERREG